MARYHRPVAHRQPCRSYILVCLAEPADVFNHAMALALRLQLLGRIIVGHRRNNYIVSGDNHDCSAFRGAAIDAA